MCLALVHWMLVVSWISIISPQSAPLVWEEDFVNLNKNRKKKKKYLVVLQLEITHLTFFNYKT